MQNAFEMLHARGTLLGFGAVCRSNC